jgi:hypothetical protein
MPESLYANPVFVAVMHGIISITAVGERLQNDHHHTVEYLTFCDIRNLSHDGQASKLHISEVQLLLYHQECSRYGNEPIAVAFLPHAAATDVIPVWLWVFNHDHTFAIAKEG